MRSYVRLVIKKIVLDVKYMVCSVKLAIVRYQLGIALQRARRCVEESHEINRRADAMMSKINADNEGGAHD